jgi:photosystem II stability/assembly factor-like uncharacterized protein
MVEREFKRLRIDKRIQSAITSANAGVICRFLFQAFFIVVVIFPITLQAQWKRLGNFGATVIYFVDLPGPPRIGFAASAGGDSGLFKTTDGGQSWKNIMLPPILDTNTLFTDMVFKDSLTGWMSVWGSPVSIGGSGGCAKTTDGGETWFFLKGSGSIGRAVYFDKKSDGLFLSTFGADATFSQGGTLESWDEGNTWKQGAPGFSLEYGGFAFSSDDSGILACYDRWIDTWYNTTNAGVTWNPIIVDTECWQPLAIPGTQTYFANTPDGAIYRTDDSWSTYHLVYQFPPQQPDTTAWHQSSCICGDLNNLIVQIGPGCYRSIDQGVSWQFLCGPGWSDGINVTTTFGPQRFYVNGNLIYCETNTDSGGGVWELNLDSLNMFSTIFSFPDSTKLITIPVGNKVTVNFSPQTSDPIGVDSGHIVIHFDSTTLTLDSLALPPSWVIRDSTSGPGYLNIFITADSSQPLPNPIITLTFNTYLSSNSSAKVYLDSAHLYGHRLNCDCSALSTDVDSVEVEVDFAGCADSILLAVMNGGQIVFNIESIQPNPAADEVTVQLSGSVQPEIEMFDALGRSVLTTPQPPPSIGEGVVFDVSKVPSGIYFLRLSSGGYVQSRSVVVQH